MAQIVTKRESLARPGLGTLVQFIGLLLCLTCYGALVGLPMMVCGVFMARYHICGACGTRLEDKYVSICPACGSPLSPP